MLSIASFSNAVHSTHFFEKKPESNNDINQSHLPSMISNVVNSNQNINNVPIPL